MTAMERIKQQEEYGIAILLMGGKGERFGSDKNRSLLNGKPVFLWSVEAFVFHPHISHVILVCSQENKKYITVKTKHLPNISCILGGSTRHKSAIHGFQEAKKHNPEILVFHNAANPLVQRNEITAVIEEARKYGSAGVGQKVTSTLRKDTGGTLSRKHLWSMQTPQAIRTSLYATGQERIESEKQSFSVLSDDLCIAEATGNIPILLPSSPQNIKITTPDDIGFLENMCLQKSVFQTGIGHDSHRFGTDGILMLGGVQIAPSPKLLANSDGDVLIHALCNAIGSGMGQFSFSSYADTLCQNGEHNSVTYLLHALSLLREEQGNIQHISLSIEAQKPKLEPHLPRIQQTLAEICHILPRNIGITVHSGEQMSDAGRGIGISVTAIVTLLFPR